MGSIRTSSAADVAKPMILTPSEQVPFMGALPKRGAVVWSGDPAEWQECAGKLWGAHVIIDRSADPEWIKACKRLLVGVAAEVSVQWIPLAQKTRVSSPGPLRGADLPTPLPQKTGPPRT
jgi:hypothetical protein